MIRARRLRPEAPAQRQGKVPAPIGGVNTVDVGSEMPGLDCPYAYNLIASEQGLRARTGYQEWCTSVGVNGALGNAVLTRTLLPFTGSTVAKNRLFAVMQDGIYDVSTSMDSPTFLYEFTVSHGGDSGHGVGRVVVTAAGHFMLYADEVNGLHVYTESTDTWAAVAMGGGGSEISGLDPADIVHVGVFKGRVWAVERDTAKVWYSATGAIYGAYTAFDFAGNFRAGGHLVGTWNWTYDGGAGMDDLLVGVSSGGDVAIYAGTDPSDATKFGLKGVWNVGAVPAGRHIATANGGDLLLVTALGVLPLSKLVTGANVSDAGIYETRKISNFFSLLVGTYGSLRGWSIVIHPTDNALMVTCPTAADTDTNQLAMSYATRGWFQYRDLPILSACVWDGKVYFGTADGRVCISTGYVDDVSLDATEYTPVKYSGLTAFRDLDNANQKQVHLVIPTLLSQSASPLIECAARYTFNMTEPNPPSGSSLGAEGSFDASTWDESVWGGDYIANQPVRGAVGMGREVAIAFRGEAVARTTIVNFRVTYTEGGVL